MIEIPELPHHCNSWIVYRKSDMSVVGEFYDRRILEKLNPEKCIVVTVLDHLVGRNKENK